MSDAGPITWKRARWALGLVVCLPVAAAGAAVIGRHWVPVGDEASILFRVGQVGGGQTPLVGAYSTHGWAHPGPALYLLLAVPYRVIGGGTTGLLVAAAVLNLLSVALVLYLAWRRRGLLGLLAFGLVTATLLVGLTPELLVQVWNPYVPLLPFLAFLLCAWSLAEGDRRLLPLAVGLGSFLVQAHVAYLPLVLGAVGGVVAWRLWGRSAVGSRRGIGDRAETGSVRWTFGAFAVGVVLWIPPLVDQAFGDGNLGQLYRYFTSSPPSVGVGRGLGLLSAEVAPLAAWSGGTERSTFGSVDPGSRLWLLGLVVLLVGSVVLSRVAGRSAALPTVALTAIGAAAVAVTRVEEPVFPYLVVWALPLAAFAWAAVLETALEAARQALATYHPARRTRLLRAAALAVLMVATAGQVARGVAGAPGLGLPAERRAAATTSLLHQLRPELAPHLAYRVEAVDDQVNQIWVGVFYGLVQRHLDVRTSDGANGQKWGRTHRWTDQPVDQVLTFATADHVPPHDAIERCAADHGVTRIAAWDQLSSRQRAELRDLYFRAYTQRTPLSDAQAARRQHLDDRSLRVAVFSGDHVCGTQRRSG